MSITPDYYSWDDTIESEIEVKSTTLNVRFPRVSDLRKARGNKCEQCNANGSKVQLEFAHVKPTALRFRGRGQTQRYYDIKNNPECYKLVCKGCHRKL